MTVAQHTPPRSDVPKEQTWNAESVFPDHAAWQAELEAVKGLVDGVSQYPGTLSQSSEKLADWLDYSEQLSRRLWKLGFYANMSSAVDNDDVEAKKLVGQFASVMGKASAVTSFAEPEILAIGQETLNAWMEADDRLKVYEHHINDMFRMAQHTRSAEVEEVLGLASEPLRAISSTTSELTQSDLNFPDAHDSSGNVYDVNQSNIGTHLASDDRERRRTAWEGYADSYLSMKNTLTANYIASVKASTFQARVRGYDSVLEMVLKPYNLPVEVFHNLINTYKKHLPTWHRYWDVRRRALDVSHIHPYDIWAPIATQPYVTFEQSVDWIATGMQPLGDDYVAALRQGCLQDRWVDRAVNKGKRQGAFSGGSYDTFPFIMMSYDDDLKAMSTLAHELGHSLHSYHSRKTQPFVYSGYSMFVAEVASNFNQAMTRAYLFEEKKNDANFQIALIEEAMSNFHRYFFIMPTLARFEYEVHQRVADGKPMTADILNGLMSDLYAEGYGDTMTDDSERTGITWAQFQHLFIPFYTFQYATGISAAHALSARILAGDASAAENYVQFLSAGSSLYPLDALKLAGVDMTTPAAVEETFGVLDSLVDRLETLIAQ